MSEMKIQRRGYTLKVDRDYSYEENPRIFNSNLGRMVCWHRRYNLGDIKDFKTPFEFQVYTETHKNDIYAILNVYLYDHSGLAISTRDFKDPWDSGQIGYIYCRTDDVIGAGFNPETDYEKVKEILEKEVQEYDNYLQGTNEYYYFCLRDEDFNIIDSISGFQKKNLKDMLNEMKEYVDKKYYFLFDTLYKKEMNKEDCL